MMVARAATVAARTRAEVTELHRVASHGPSFMGGTREMRSTSEDIPDEQAVITRPPETANDLLWRVRHILAEHWDVTATRDRSNMDAVADIVVDGETFAEGVPVSTLLFLEKQLADLHTFVKAMPVRDPSKIWQFDEDLGFHRAPEDRKARTRKTIKAAELSPATDRHPAQVQPYNVDEVVGHYISTEFSSALSAQEKRSTLDRVRKLADAVKAARTKANETEVTDMRIGAELLGRIFTR